MAVQYMYLPTENNCQMAVQCTCASLPRDNDNRWLFDALVQFKTEYQQVAVGWFSTLYYMYLLTENNNRMAVQHMYLPTKNNNRWLFSTCMYLPTENDNRWLFSTCTCQQRITTDGCSVHVLANKE